MPADPALQGLAAVRRLTTWFLAPVLLLLGVLSTLQYQQHMADARAELLRRNGQHAQELQLLARPAMDHVQDLRNLMESVWAAPPDPGTALRSALQPQQRNGAPDGVAISNAADGRRWGQVWWSEAGNAAFDEQWLRRAAAFITQARVAHLRTPGFEATWLASMGPNTSYGYPWVDIGSILQSMGLKAMRELIPVREAANERTLKREGEQVQDYAHWGPPYVSQIANHLVVSHMAPVRYQGRIVAEVSLDFRIEALQAKAVQWAEAGERSWILDQQQRVLADSAAPLQQPSSPGHADESIDSRWAERLPAGLDREAALQLVKQPGQVRSLGDWVLVSSAEPGSPWTFVRAVPLQELRARIWPGLLPNLLIGLALLGTLISAQYLLARYFLQPATQLLAYLRALSHQPDAPAPRLGTRWQLWVDSVTQTFQQQRELQRLQRSSEARKSAILDHALEAMVSTDAQGRIVEFNPAAEAMFGRTLDEVRGQDVTSLIMPTGQREAHRLSMLQLRAGQAAVSMGQRTQRQALRRDGSEFPVEMVMWRSEVEGEVHFTASLVDISERLAARQEIERQRDSLRQSEKLSAMGGLLAGVAHELNNPLAIVMGRASLLEDKLEGQDTQSDARRIREAAERCGRIVRIFLNMARARAPRRAALQLNDTVRAAAEMLAYTLNSHGIKMELQLDADLPQAIGDADQLGQVLLNLIVNAQHALLAVEGERRLRISSGTEHRRSGREPRIWLRVEDNGAGIPAELRERIFEPFFTTKAEGLGTGLGLSVSRSMLREHGGDLQLEGQAELGGASFRLSLPISGMPETDGAVDQGGGPQEARHGRVLVVDDEAELAELMRETLEGAGYEVAVAESGPLALALIEEARFDAVVSDLRMPEMDGAALWRAIEALEPTLLTRMVFVTGDILSPAAADFLKSSGCQALEKPFQPQDLIAAVAALIDSAPAS
ncbi:PAS domain S-box protein [Paucibacter sp. APW11]|uniref:histidine kinase n=1 Tax=Roseateles aquae TaxID=3077235 RepID=A0ABU3PDM9_9BURK|nr:PAS domain S-box protein [Paucibacter sp. APW11]MDT9000677.1 PAS domain S-box protein [Paucibacter sp. APW11]